MPSPSSSRKQLTASEIVERKRRKRKLDDGNETEAEQQPPLHVDSDVSIDEQIRRLESELQGDSSDSGYSDSGDSGSKSSTDSSTRRRQQQQQLQRPDDAVWSLSTVQDDRIQALPKHHLPAVPPIRKKGKKQKRSGDSSSTSTSSNPAVASLEKVVNTVLDGYKARSSEHLPFYCRYCSMQYDNLQDFKLHKDADFHKMAVRMEQRRTYCKLCKKQLTSLVQMKEHLESKPHKQRLESVQARQQGRGRLAPSRRAADRTSMGPQHRYNVHPPRRRPPAAHRR